MEKLAHLDPVLSGVLIHPHHIQKTLSVAVYHNRIKMNRWERTGNKDEEEVEGARCFRVDGSRRDEFRFGLGGRAGGVNFCALHTSRVARRIYIVLRVVEKQLYFGSLWLLICLREVSLHSYHPVQSNGTPEIASNFCTR